jgi:hypothetical protein
MEFTDRAFLVILVACAVVYVYQIFESAEKKLKAKK